MNHSPSQSVKLFASAIFCSVMAAGSFQVSRHFFSVMPPLKISVSRARVMAT